MGKAFVTWILLSVFGFFGWNYGAAHFFPRLAQYHQGILVCGAVAACVMIGLVLTGKTK